MFYVYISGKEAGLNVTFYLCVKFIAMMKVNTKNIN